MSDQLNRPLSTARITGLSGSVAGKLAAKGVHTVRDLLEQTPRRYVDLSHAKPIRDVKVAEEATIVGTVKAVNGRYLGGPRGKGPRYKSRHMVTVSVYDGTGYVDAVWWNQPYRERQFSEGMTVAVAGKFERRRGRLQVSGNPLVEAIKDESAEGVHTGRIIPVHPATEGVSPAMLRRYVYSALKTYGSLVDDPLPPEIVERLEFPPRAEALQTIHFPPNLGAMRRARRRLAFEELFVLSAGLALRKRHFERDTRGMPLATKGVEEFLEGLPFRPTAAQRRVIDEIATDMARPIPMHRLLQGEVGSGKTVVAVAAAIVAAANGTQTALMAPTEVLAEQHYLTIRQLLSPMSHLAPSSAGQLSFEGPGFTVELLTGSVTGKTREAALDAARDGRAHLLIGTHALIQSGVEFARLGVAVIDEQHRFGVHQRVALRGKSASEEEPHVLIMTATPIPRTLALTLYGDLDVSSLDEMPPGRTPVRTLVLGSERRRETEQIIREEVIAGHQAFVICPLVEKSEGSQAKAAEQEYQRIKDEVFPNLRVGLIHGRLRPGEKDAVMTRMRAGEIDVLVATTVIEVGVDIPNATVILVEDADRFGLSQLHQLRGRIGRGSGTSTCILMTSIDLSGDDPEREEARRRLEAMRETTDGFKLAELDLEIRGEGQIFGRAKLDPAKGEGAPVQAGANDLRFASLLRDADLLVEARREAFAVVDDDPRLSRAEHASLLAEVRHRFADRLDWLFAG